MNPCQCHSYFLSVERSFPGQEIHAAKTNPRHTSASKKLRWVFGDFVRHSLGGEISPHQIGTKTRAKVGIRLGPTGLQIRCFRNLNMGDASYRFWRWTAAIASSRESPLAIRAAINGSSGVGAGGAGDGEEGVKSASCA